jgi:hypothetical protein
LDGGVDLRNVADLWASEMLPWQAVKGLDRRRGRGTGLASLK